jgi:hypothetical protein
MEKPDVSSCLSQPLHATVFRFARIDHQTLSVRTVFSRTPEHLNDVVVRVLKVLGYLVQGIVGIVAALWLSIVGLAQYHCSVIPWIGTCKSFDEDAWLVPLFLAPIGVPALIASIVILAIRWIARAQD